MALHGTAEGNTLFELTSDVFSDQLGIRFRALDLVDANIDFFTGEELEFALDAFQFFALLADDDTRTGGKEVDVHLLDSAFDANLGEGGVFEALHQVTAEHDILIEEIGKVVFGIPLGFPTADDAKTKTIGMTLVTHC